MPAHSGEGHRESACVAGASRGRVGGEKDLRFWLLAPSVGDQSWSAKTGRPLATTVSPRASPGCHDGVSKGVMASFYSLVKEEAPQGPQMVRSTDVDSNLEPVHRSRSNTWPLPCPEVFMEGDETPVESNTPGDQSRAPGGILSDLATGAPKKNTSRRNPWGNLSYADLIAQAIISSPDGRATLSQIYDWMVQNVPYFKDKGDSNSSAGWKNSIRHNLSLHNRFMRVQNEGTGKSSWWVLNPDAKPGKSTRRRANTMEGSRYEKKRGRGKKKLDALRNGLETTPSPSSSLSENIDMFPESPLAHHPAFTQISPQDFRPRASSNASSCGRLSPIPALESDMRDSQVPPMSPSIGGWANEYWSHQQHATHHLGHPHERYAEQQLVETMDESFNWVGVQRQAMASQHCMKLQQQLSPHGHPQMNGFLQQHTHHHHPQFEEFQRYGAHSYPSHFQQHHPTPPSHQDKMQSTGPVRPQHPHNSYPSLPALVDITSPPHNGNSLSPTQPLVEGHFPGSGNEVDMRSAASYPTPPSSHPPTSEPGGIMRLSLQDQGQAQQSTNNTQSQQTSPQNSHHQTSPSQHQQSPRSHHLLHQANGPSSMADFIDLDTIHGGLECNVEELLKNELQMGENLDFSFQHENAQTHLQSHVQSEASQRTTAGHPLTPYACSSLVAGNHWVR